MFLAACIQQRCTTDTEANLKVAETLIRRAAGYGAKLVATPENTAFLGPQFHKIETAESLDGLEIQPGGDQRPVVDSEDVGRADRVDCGQRRRRFGDDVK